MIQTVFHYYVTLWIVLTIFIKEALCLSIDKLLLQGNDAPNVMEFQFDEASGVYSFDLDLLFTRQQWAKLMERNHTSVPGGRRKRKGSLLSELWPNADIPYEISKYYEQNDILTVKNAIANWEKHTCVRFRQATPSDTHKLIFSVSSSCKSFVGRDSEGPQKIYLSEDCRQMEGVITHELGHVLGLYHEQSRYDRDNFVTINWDKIPEMSRRNFELLAEDVMSNYGVPYDYKSIMHYGATAFSPDDEYTIIPKDYRFANVIGNREQLSFRDIKIINVMYRCGGHCPGQCPGEGFHDKSCQCVCPGDPIQPCSKGGTEDGAGGQLPPGWKPSTNPDSKPCIDDNSQCDNWAAGDQCNKNSAFMQKYCRKACGICGDKTPECKDANANCVQWTRAGECTRNPTYMKSYCRKSCGLCGGAVQPTQPPCRDLNPNCVVWGQYYCNKPANAAFMARNCKKSCNLCGPGGSYSDDPTSTCRDKDSSCKGWSDVGECEKNPAFMLANCKKSCGKCESGSSGNMLSDDPGALCTDASPSCVGWSRVGECQKNPGYMNVHCKKSCNQC